MNFAFMKGALASTRLIVYRCAVKWRAMETPGPCKEWNDEIVPTTFEPTSEDADGVASPVSRFHHAGNGIRK
jgi:hypothetical protein